MEREDGAWVDGGEPVVSGPGLCGYSKSGRSGRSLSLLTCRRGDGYGPESKRYRQESPTPVPRQYPCDLGLGIETVTDGHWGPRSTE